ncbi:HAMP domain-containing sensor histidine kinase [Metaclostridioides mangenotii]|uniref:HAMP domain-containing sensor histidine kinase n=1 Tax=Metaclostridioides mangenotii TaxID=1540 RepID=UPI0028EA627E|nr:HAMP domain-containing sensor histidine kinase [Clostridioides mangenotii]
MIKHLKPSRLGWKILFYIVVSVLVAFILNVPFYNMLENGVTKAAEEKHYFQSHLTRLVDDLQLYIDENDLKTSDSEMLSYWNDDKWYVYMNIHKDKKILYDTVNYPKKISDEDEQRELQNNDLMNNYSLKFKDTTATITITAFFNAKYQNFINAASVAFLAIAFISTFLLLFSKKIKYIKEIEQGIKIAESGSLEYRIPVKGNDELSSLAKSINEMSGVITDQLLLESEMRQKNKDMVTSISHDIRTPLTSVICYLDLIADGKYSDKEQLDKYIENARLNAYQIKKLSENLFIHFVTSPEDVDYEIKRINANEFIFQLILDTTFELEENNFEVKVKNELHKQIHIDVDITQFRRIFTNICSNIIKYADKDAPIEFLASMTKNFLLIKQANQVSNSKDQSESFGIGIKNCKEIVKNHNGFLNVFNGEKDFLVEIGIPISSTGD